LLSAGCRFIFGSQTRPLFAKRNSFTSRFYAYTVISSTIYVNEKGFVVAKEERIVFEKGNLRHESRKVEIWDEKKQSVVLLFYDDTVNAIQIQTWVVLIANLLCTVIERKIKRHCSFSQIA
jgi:hypothetical protein